MREIKFRVWDVEYKTFDKVVAANLLQQIHEGDWIDPEYGKRFFLQEYTGLKDKNGVEIYEGDILSNGVEWCNAEIKFDKGCFMWNNEPIGFNGDDDGYTDSPPSTWGEVIGNIYEHPNLLK